MVPLTLWLPYERYRHTHHVHHIDARLTDPLDDPESFYWRAGGLGAARAGGTPVCNSCSRRSPGGS